MLSAAPKSTTAGWFLASAAAADALPMAATANAAATHIRVDCMIVPFESLNDIDPARGGAPYEYQLNTFAGASTRHGGKITFRLHNAVARAMNDERARALAARLAGGFDLHQQILAANIRLQVHDGGRGAQRARQRPFDGVEIRRLPNVDLEFEIVEGVARRSDHAIRLVQQGVDVCHGFARLRGHVARMNGFVADDARGAGDEQIRSRRFAQHTGAR